MIKLVCILFFGHCIVKYLFFIGAGLIAAVLSLEIADRTGMSVGRQDFEVDFTMANYPEEFLPGWYGNEVRSTSSRIFQSSNLGRNGSSALAVQPIASFSGEIRIRLAAEQFNDPTVQFWARSIQNGSGNRPAQIFYSWSALLDEGYSTPELLGGEDEFANVNQEFKRFHLDVPLEYKEMSELFLRIEVRYGPGEGSCARWVMDDFVFGDIPRDTIPPQVEEIKGYDEKEILLQFSEPVDPVFAQFLINYRLEDTVEPIMAEVQSDSLVRLIFDYPFYPGRNYSLLVQGVPDLEGNFMADTKVDFLFYDPTDIQFKGLVINEIMAAPREGLFLPNVEYVEVFHAGEYTYTFRDLRWANSRTEVLLEEYWIDPGEYVLLVPDHQAYLMEPYGRVVPVSHWPTLLNSGDELILRDDKEKLVDRVRYATSSWGGAEYAAGGYSLEVVNPFSYCDQSELLRHSLGPQRGTPGSQNSVFGVEADQDPPVVTDAVFLSPDLISISFSKPILPVFDSVLFVFDPPMTIDSAYQGRSTEVLLNLESPAEESLQYSLQISLIRDCAGNVFQMDAVRLVLPAQPAKGDVVLNEVLFNPITGSPKFVELANATDKYLEIGNWKLANRDAAGNPSQLRILDPAGLVLMPRGYLAVTTNAAQLFRDYPKSTIDGFHEITTLPSYPISGGIVVLMDADDTVVDSFTYNESMHHPLLRNPKGVSLERLAMDSPTDQLSNWHSASGIEDYATPGRKNSQAISAEFDGDIIQLEPEVFDPEGSNGITFTTIKYELDQAGWVGSFRIYAISGQLIQVLVQNELLGAKGHFIWTGTDDQGRSVRPGYYILIGEFFDLNGRVRTVRKSIVVATRL